MRGPLRVLALLRGKFFRNFMTVMAGTALSQAILVASAPVLSRLYSPEDFGISGIVMSIAGIIVPVSCLTLDLAIVLPDRNEKAHSLLQLCLTLAAAVALFSAIVIGLFWNEIAEFLGLSGHSWAMIFIPLLLFLGGFEEIFHRWIMRAGRFTLISTLSVVGAVGVSLLKIGGGLTNPTAFLLLSANAAGTAVNLGALLYFSAPWRGTASAPVRLVTLDGMRRLFSEFNDFTMYKAPQMLVGMLSTHLPLLLIGALGSTEGAGLYSIARTAIALPIQVIIRSLWTVLSPKFAEVANQGQAITWHLVMATSGLLALGAPIFGVVFLFGPELFAFVFGDEWRMSGEFARYLSIWLYLSFAAMPATNALAIIRQQRSLLILEVTVLPLRMAALAIGIQYYDSALVGVMAMSLIAGASQAFLIVNTIARCRAFYRRDGAA